MIFDFRNVFCSQSGVFPFLVYTFQHFQKVIFSRPCNNYKIKLLIDLTVFRTNQYFVYTFQHHQLISRRSFFLVHVIINYKIKLLKRCKLLFKLIDSSKYTFQHYLCLGYFSYHAVLYSLF